MRRALLCSLLLTFCCCAPRLNVTPQLESAFHEIAVISESWGGYTACGTRMRSWFPHEHVSPRTRRDSLVFEGIKAHEAAHRQFYADRGFTSCQEYMLWLRSSVNRLQSEAFAFCAQAHVEYALGMHISLDAAFFERAADLMSPVYPTWPLTRATATELIAVSCAVGGP